jgi:hypothetical protein
MSRELWLLAGVPCAGKSKFSEWLEKKHSFRHYNVDLVRKDEGHLRDDGLLDLWKECREKHNVEPFVQAIRDLDQDTVLDWGFTGGELDIVRALKKQGFKTWWLDADGAAARESFTARFKLDPDKYDLPPWVFEIQMSFIRAARDEILEMFTSSHILPILDAEGNHTDSKVIYDEIMSIQRNERT